VLLQDNLRTLEMSLAPPPAARDGVVAMPGPTRIPLHPTTGSLSLSLLCTLSKSCTAAGTTRPLSCCACA
jgi:hypothetical protein